MNLIFRMRDIRGFEFYIYTLFSITSLAAVLLLFYRFPVHFSFLITEDCWGEYLSFFGFAISGIVLITYSIKVKPIPSRILWFMIGGAFLAIAGEEISWGQRLLHLPDIGGLKKLNAQGELTIHNLPPIASSLSIIKDFISYAILLYVFFSAFLSFRMKSLYNKLMELGFPLIPPHLASIFLLVPIFWKFNLTAKNDEVGEMFLAIAVLMWSIDMVLSRGITIRFQKPARIIVVFGALSVAIATASAFSNLQNNQQSIRHRLNLMASRDYPNLDMYSQAEEVFQYLYDHPQYLNSFTRINHSLVLQKSRNFVDAKICLTAALKELDQLELHDSERIEYMIKLGKSYRGFSWKTKAQEAFSEAVKIAHGLVSETNDANQKARFLLKSAKALNEWGRKEDAKAEINKARSICTSPALQFVIERYSLRI